MPGGWRLLQILRRPVEETDLVDVVEYRARAIFPRLIDSELLMIQAGRTALARYPELGVENMPWLGTPSLPRRP